VKDRSSDKGRFALSVCIPVFNFDIRFLIMRLANEISAKEYQDRVEFIIVDDCSTNIVLKEVNRQFLSEKDVENCQSIELEQNVGRAKGRNVLSERASGDFLLFF
jgi:GT2 family glycosyltransferase